MNITPTRPGNPRDSAMVGNEAQGFAFLKHTTAHGDDLADACGLRPSGAPQITTTDPFIQLKEHAIRKRQYLGGSAR